MKRIGAVLPLLLMGFTASAHPTGTMVVINDKVLWSYVCPIGDPDHHACVMIWDENVGAHAWLTSTFPASDWMMTPAPEGKVYLVERYFDQALQMNKARLLIATPGGEPEELIPWFNDDHRFGEGGFAPMQDGRFLFARYPNLYVLSEDASVTLWKEWPFPVNGLRLTADGSLLIRGESQVWLTTPDGTLLKKWTDLLEELNTEPPFMGNRIFDVAYSDGILWIAYWGKRRFDFIDGESRTVIKSLEAPWLPHAIAANNRTVFMLASTIAPELYDIRPNLWRMQEGKLDLIWKGQ